jgi:hypothetical protein
MKKGLLVFIFLVICSFAEFPAFCQKKTPTSQLQQKIPASFCISPVEVELYNKINEYRRLYGLPPIPFSRSLSYVARTHVKDLYNNHPDQGPCNFHSWSNKGNWKPFCYPRDEKKNVSVWDKPKEISPYKSKGYEIVYWENNPVNIDSIVPFWRSIEYFNSFLICSGKWSGKKWQAIGIGIYENYAAAWFGEIPDAEGEPWICGQEPAKQHEPETPAPIVPVNEQKNNVQKEEVKADTIARPAIYYIIVSSQQPRVKSNQFAAQLIEKGYKDAKVLVKSNKIRVSIMEYKMKPQADSALREVKKLYKEAWIYRQSLPDSSSVIHNP